MKIYKQSIIASAIAATLAISHLGGGPYAYYSGYIIRANGDLYVTGINSKGQLGTGNATTQTVWYGPVLTNVAQVASGITTSGDGYAIALKRDGTVWSTGFGSNYSLANGAVGNLNVFTKVTGITNAIQVACGQGSTWILKADNSLWVCGYHSSGTFGIGDGTASSTAALNNVLNNVKQVSAGATSTYAVMTDGSLYVTGNNGNGQLGLGNYTTPYLSWTNTGMSNVKQVASGENHAMCVKNDGSLWVTGLNSHNELGNGNATRLNTWTSIGFNNVTKIVCNMQNSMILLSNGIVMVCGPKATCGGGATGNFASFSSILNNIIDIGTYRQTFFAVDSSNNVRSTGDNTNYIQGLGNQTAQTSWVTQGAL